MEHAGLAISQECWRALQERAQLKAQERAKQEAEEARKRTVRVTIDLLGRQVTTFTARHATNNKPRQQCARIAHLEDALDRQASHKESLILRSCNGAPAVQLTGPALCLLMRRHAI